MEKQLLLYTVAAWIAWTISLPSALWLVDEKDLRAIIPAALITFSTFMMLMTASFVRLRRPASAYWGIAGSLLCSLVAGSAVAYFELERSLIFYAVDATAMAVAIALIGDGLHRRHPEAGSVTIFWVYAALEFVGAVSFLLDDFKNIVGIASSIWLILSGLAFPGRFLILLAWNRSIARVRASSRLMTADSKTTSHSEATYVVNITGSTIGAVAVGEGSRAEGTAGTSDSGSKGDGS